MKVLVLSALAADTGSCLRARSIARALAPHAEVELLRPPARSRPLMLEVALSAPAYLLRALSTDADCLLAVKPMPNVVLALYLAGRLRGRTAVVDVDDMDWGFFSGWRARILRRVQLPWPRRLDLVTFHNENLRGLLEGEFQVPAERCWRLLQGVDLDVFRPRDVPLERGSLLHVGHLNVASELPWILDAVALLDPDAARLTVAGGGPCLARMRALAAEKGVDARFTGPLEPEGVAAEIARAEVCLVRYAPTEVNRHRSSMKLRECLAMEKKVVCNRFDELERFAPFVWSAPDDDPAGYARAIEQALAAPPAGDGRERRGAEHVRGRYDWRALGKELHERLRVLVEGAPS